MQADKLQKPHENRCRQKWHCESSHQTRYTKPQARTGCTDTYKEVFASNNLPEKCPGHGSQRLCTVSGKIANEYCPSTKVNSFGAVLPKEQLNLWKAVNGKNATSGTRVEEVCDIHKKPEEKPKEEEKPKNNTNTNTEKTNTENKTNTNTNPTKPEINTGGDSTEEKPDAGDTE